MKIAYFIDIFYPDINGIITSTSNLAQNLIKRGHKAYFITPKKENFNEPIVQGNIPVFYVPSTKMPVYPEMRFNLPHSKSFETFIKEEKPDIFHITSPWLMGWLAIHHGKKHNIPIVQTFHTMITEPHYIKYVIKNEKFIPITQKILWWYIGLSLKNSDYITAPNQYARNEILKHYSTLHVEEISNGLDLEIFKKHKTIEETKKLYPFINEKSFIYIGRLGKEKSVNILIEAMEKLIKLQPEARLIIVGDGPEREKLINMMNRINVSRNITFTGKIPHTDLLQSGLIHYSKCFVTASTSEVQPMTVLEALLCNTPAIVPNVPGIRDMVPSTKTLFTPNSPQELAILMDRILSDITFYNSIKEETQSNFEKYDGMKVAERFENIYLQLLTQKTPYTPIKRDKKTKKRVKL